MNERNRTFEFTCTISPDGAVVIQNEDGSNGCAWGPGTMVATEIVDCLDDQNMFTE